MANDKTDICRCAIVLKQFSLCRKSTKVWYKTLLQDHISSWLQTQTHKLTHRMPAHYKPLTVKCPNPTLDTEPKALMIAATKGFSPDRRAIPHSVTMWTDVNNTSTHTNTTMTQPSYEATTWQTQHMFEPLRLVCVWGCLSVFQTYRHSASLIFFTSLLG